MPPRKIASRRNPRVLVALKLRDRRGRQQQGRFLIDGARELGRAIASGIELVEAFVCPELCDSPDSRHALDALRRSGAPLWEVTPEVLEKLTYGERAEGVLGIARPPQQSLQSLELPERPLVAVLEGVEKPGNLGAVLRSADGAGVSAVIVADPRTDLYNPNTIRASLGTIFHLPVLSATAQETLDWLRTRGLRLYAARLDAALPYHQADLTVPCALLLGSEASGLSPLWHAEDIAGIVLPMRGIADSLNLSSTAAILFYEALRQRGSQRG